MRKEGWDSAGGGIASAPRASRRAPQRAERRQKRRAAWVNPFPPLNHAKKPDNRGADRRPPRATAQKEHRPHHIERAGKGQQPRRRAGVRVGELGTYPMRRGKRRFARPLFYGSLARFLLL